tara:strand:+ start:380 stop:1174 length:795 start_codon:yes stop_codon:yes gene_type:complete
MKKCTFGTLDLVTEGSSIHSRDVGALIGKKASGIKKCISGAWEMYEKLQSSDNPVDEKKPSLKIIYHPLKDEPVNPEYPEQVWVEIISESETMQKIARLSVKKSVKEFLCKKTLDSQEFIIEIPHRLLGKLIGKKAAGLNNILNKAIFEKKKVMIDQNDVEIAKTARLRIKELKFDEPNCQKIITYVKQRNNRCFLGWPPEIDDDYTEHISINLSFKRDSKPFNDIQIYLERIRNSIIDRIMEIKEFDNQQMDEINECLGFDFE